MTRRSILSRLGLRTLRLTLVPLIAWAAWDAVSIVGATGQWSLAVSTACAFALSFSFSWEYLAVVIARVETGVPLWRSWFGAS